MNISHQQSYSSLVNLNQKIGSLWQRALTDVGVTSMQSSAIMALGAHDLNVRRIAEALAVTSSAATQLIEVLQDKGIALRANSQTDRRIVMVSLTDDGRRIYERLVAAQAQLIDTIVGGLSDVEAVQLTQLHSQMIQRIDAVK